MKIEKKKKEVVSFENVNNIDLDELLEALQSNNKLEQENILNKLFQNSEKITLIEKKW